MLGGVFQGANLPDFSDAVNMFTITNAPAQGVMTLQLITNTTAFRYVRYLSGVNGFCNAAELEFFQALGSWTNVVWSGAVSASWDTTATANWLNNGASGPYQDGDAVLCDDTALSNTTVSVSSGVTPAFAVVNNSTKTYAISGSAIAETGSLTKLGSGALTLSSANTFGGGVTISNGTVTLGNNAGAGTGTITLAGGA